MKTLDRYVIRNFLTAVIVWFIILMSLRVVTDLFVNMDEFAKAAVKHNKTLTEMMGDVGTYYGYQFFAYVIELGGVIIVASAAFTLARMNHTNELTAMLASGVSLHRVVWPIVLCSMLMGGLIILDHELVIPEIRDKLARDRDDVPGIHEFPVRLMTDTNGSVWFSPKFKPADGTMDQPVVLLRDEKFRAVARLSGKQATPVVLNGQRGWMISDAWLARISAKEGTLWREMPSSHRILSRFTPEVLLGMAKDKGASEAYTVDGVLDREYGLKIFGEFRPDPPVAGKPRGGIMENARFVFTLEKADPNSGPRTEQLLGEFYADSARWNYGEDKGSYWELTGGKLFYPSDLTGEDMRLRQSSNWLDYMSIPDLTRLIRLQRVPDRRAAEYTRHSRIVAPINNLVMLLLGLPFILSRQRNIKASAGLCLLMVGTFFAFVHICGFMGLQPILAASLPVLLFGPVAAVMLDSIKT